MAFGYVPMWELCVFAYDLSGSLAETTASFLKLHTKLLPTNSSLLRYFPQSISQFSLGQTALTFPLDVRNPLLVNPGIERKNA